MSNKVLCLHGFLQNAKVFSEKSSGLRKLLKKAGFELDYIDGPVVLAKSDLPFEVDDNKWAEIVEQDINKAWFYHTNVSKDLEIELALTTVLNHIEKNGPYVGIIGFSQGAAISTIIANIIKRRDIGADYFKFALHISGYTFTEPKEEGSTELVITDRYKDYFRPPIEDESYHTKSLIVYGENDNSVPAKRTIYLSELYPENFKKVFAHDGGHFAPNKKDFLKPLIEEIKKSSKA